MAKQPISITGLWLRREGQHAVVLAEMGGEWIEVIRDLAEGPFSHIAEPAGIYARLEAARTVLSSTGTGKG